MFVVFEGIDGSGKTTISNRVAKALRERGLAVEHLREEGAFASKVTQGIRDFCRDACNMALTPRAELMLYLAREVQLSDEVLRPALARADVVIADRYFYTAAVLAEGRDLPPEETAPLVNAAANGLWPDLGILIDVDPSVARGRRKVAKILCPDRRATSRKGLTGSGLQLRLRAAYRALAERDPDRWIVVDNTDAELGRVVQILIDAVAEARGRGRWKRPARAWRPSRRRSGRRRSTTCARRWRLFSPGSIGARCASRRWPPTCWPAPPGTGSTSGARPWRSRPPRWPPASPRRRRSRTRPGRCASSWPTWRPPRWPPAWTGST